MKKNLRLREFFAELNDETDQELQHFIHERIKSFNDSISIHHRKARKEGVKPLNLQVVDSKGEIIAGLIADTYWGWLDIDDFWIDEHYRGQGLGREMILAAEKEALARECRFIHLKTFSFQARGFYEKCGYQVVGQLNDYPPGQSLYWMRKDLI